MREATRSTRFSKTLAIFAMLVVGPDMLYGQLREDLRTEILVYITPGALEFPADERGALALGTTDRLIYLH